MRASNEEEGRPSTGSAGRDISPKKLAANAANAARSTGPRTPAGKERSSKNAVRHGLTAQAPLLPGESAEQLDELARDMEADLRPRVGVEREVVARIVSLTWRLRRVARAEEALWDAADERRRQSEREFEHIQAQVGRPLMPWRDPDEPMYPMCGGAEFVARQFEQSRPSAIERLAVYEQRLDRALHAAYRQLRALREMQDETGDEEETRQEPVAPTETAAGSDPAATGVEAGDGASSQLSDGTPGHILQNEPTAGAAASPTPVWERSEGPDSGAG
jgi:hypothetical protein